MVHLQRFNMQKTNLQSSFSKRICVPTSNSGLFSPTKCVFDSHDRCRLVEGYMSDLGDARLKRDQPVLVGSYQKRCAEL